MITIEQFFETIFTFPYLKGVLVFAVAFFLFLLFCVLKRVTKKEPPHGLARIVGMEETKERIYNEVIFPFYHKEKYKKFHISLPNGILFYGPPGCGKTFFVECLAEELTMNYINVSHADLASPYIHETVKRISELFETAKASAPCLLFIDEIEGLVPKRDFMGGNTSYKHEEVNEFLLHLGNAAQNGILVIGATNHLKKIDPSVLRSGRFDLKIYIAPPDEKARAQLFLSELENIPHLDNIDYSELARLTEGYTNSDIVSIVSSAAREAISLGKEYITPSILKRMIKSTPSSLEEENDINFFEEN